MLMSRPSQRAATAHPQVIQSTPSRASRPHARSEARNRHALPIAGRPRRAGRCVDRFCWPQESVCGLLRRCCTGVMMEPSSTSSLSDLPEPVLGAILRQLTAVELGRTAVQDRRLRQLCSDEGLWRTLSQRRWPLCTADHYQGSWKQLYSARARLPPTLVVAVDRCHHHTAAAAGRAPQRFNSSSLPGPGAANSPGASPTKPSSVYGVAHRPHTSIPGMLFADVMQQVYTIGLLTPAGGARSSAATSSSSSSSSSSSASSSAASSIREVQQHYQDMGWWLASRPEAVFEFVRSTLGLLTDYDPWAGGWAGWPEVPWRRSAAQFLADAAARGALGAGPCVSVTQRLSRELAKLDEAIRSVAAEACDLAVPPPWGGPPPGHWWWNVTGQMGAPIC